MSGQKEEPGKEWREAWQALMMSSVGFLLVMAVGLGAGAGMWVDRQCGSEPWGLVVGFVLGAIAGFVEVFRMARRFSKGD